MNIIKIFKTEEENIGYSQYFGISKQNIKGKECFVTLKDQGNGDFWFMEDSSEYPDIDIENWFKTELGAINYIESYSKRKIIYVYEYDDINLMWM